ncbi:hypothetical protein BDM02DRAFT_3125770 [Thelephora ganbajun]|uniref:Uncharacterized protein n=1 Tax=Thelephora ganbajun TaxID=370292 RepID=A0ACB6ZV37_THEGA|nr:hypothetical protein BDM02DRAFT_3125770 [Thelephora ganbajun]
MLGRTRSIGNGGVKYNFHYVSPFLTGTNDITSLCRILQPMAGIFVVIHERSRHALPSRASFSAPPHGVSPFGNEMEDRRMICSWCSYKAKKSIRRSWNSTVVRGGSRFPSSVSLPGTTLNYGCSLNTLNRGRGTAISDSSPEYALFQRLKISSSRSHQGLGVLATAREVGDEMNAYPQPHSMRPKVRYTEGWALIPRRLCVSATKVRIETDSLSASADAMKPVILFYGQPVAFLRSTPYRGIGLGTFL